MAQDIDIPYAGFWERFAACVIDMILFTPVYLLLMWVFRDIPTIGGSIFVILALLFYAWFFSSTWQGTPGMHWMKIHICSVEGKRLTFLHALTWGLVSAAFVTLCFSGILYVENRFDLAQIQAWMMQDIQMDGALDLRGLEMLLGIPIDQFQRLLIFSLLVFIGLSVIWILSVVLPKNKAGFHNVICRTRFVEGRPEN